MKGNGKYILVGSILIALLLVAASWKFFYSADVDNANKIQNEINGRQARLNELQAKKDNKTIYEDGIKMTEDITEAVFSQYGPGNTPEKTIMKVVDLCKMTGCTISHIAFQDNRLVYESETPELKFYKSGMSINISSGYTQLKKIMDYINSDEERMNVESFSVKFDAETGLLATTMTVNMYSVEDDKHVYEEPVIEEEIELGSDNIFKTLEFAPEEELTEENTEEGAQPGTQPKAGTTPAETNE